MPFPSSWIFHAASRFLQNLLELFWAPFSPPHPSPRNGFEEKLPCSAAYILTLSHLHCAPTSTLLCIGPTHISGCTPFKEQWDTHLVKRNFQIAVQRLLTFAGLCSREHIKSQQGLRLWLAGLSRYPPTLKRSKDETVAQRRLHQASISSSHYMYQAVADFAKEEEQGGEMVWRVYWGWTDFKSRLPTATCTVGSHPCAERERWQAADFFLRQTVDVRLSWDDDQWPSSIDSMLGFDQEITSPFLLFLEQSKDIGWQCKRQDHANMIGFKYMPGWQTLGDLGE